MNLLITGGAGYIGYSLTQRILQSYNTVEKIVIYDNLSRKNYAFFSTDKFNGKPIEFIQGDILDSRKLQKALKGIDVVIHLAAKVTTPFADYDAHFFDQINHWGTAQVVNEVEESDVKHFIYLSSASIYGRPAEDIDETFQPHPQSFYGISKMAGEKQVRRLSAKMKVHILRSGNVYGYNPAMRIDSVVNRFMFEANFNSRITVNGTGMQKRPFIHVQKLTSMVKDLLDIDVPAGTYNIAEHNFSINDIIMNMKEIYPDMEMLSMNYNMEMRDITLKTPCKIFEYLQISERSFMDELHEFKVKFSF